MNDNGKLVCLSKQSYYLDVTKGSIKRGPDLNTPSYYVNNGGNLICMQNKLYAKGFGINYDVAKNVDTAAILQQSASSTSAAPETKSGAQTSARTGCRDARTTYHHKKILHFYNQSEQEFSEIHEGVFSSSGKTKMTADLDD